MADNIVIYEPDSVSRKSYSGISSEILLDLKSNRWLTWQLFKRDFFGAYKQSIAGILWAVAMPVFSVGTFIVLSRAGIFNTGNIRTPYPVYAILGLAIWQLFSGGVVAAANSLVKSSSIIVKVNCSKKSLVIASIAQAIVPFLVQIILLVFLYFYYKIPLRMSLLLLPLLIIPLLMLSLGLSFIVAILNSILRDVGNALSFLLAFMLFLTPVLYARPTQGLLAGVTDYNLLFYLISVPRDIILEGKLIYIKGYVISTLFACFIFTAGLFIFHMSEKEIAQRI